MASNAAVAALLKPTSEHGRNVFPLDNKHVYSMKAGAITPVKCLHYEPGTHFDMSAHDFTLTFPMQTAPFLRGRKEFSFYSVYYNAVWSLFNQYQSTRNDPKSSAFGQAPNLQEPRIALRSIYGMLMPQWVIYLFHDIYIPYWRRTVYEPHFSDVNHSYDTDILTKVAQNSFLGTNSRNSLTTGFEVDDTTYNVTVGTPLQVLNLTDEFGTVTNNIPISNGRFACDINGHFRVYNWVRKLDMLGYGNVYPVLSHYEHQLIKEFEKEFNEGYSTDAKLATYQQIFYRIVRLCEKHLFDSCCTFVGSYPSATSIQDKYVNLYPICAYNSVFYHFFRNSYYDLDYYTHDYNLDFVSVDTSHGDYNICLSSDFSLRFLDIEYHQWKKDTFTGVLPDTQFGAVSQVSINLSGTVSISGVTGSDSGRWSGADGPLRPTSPILSNSYGNSLRTETVPDGGTNSTATHTHSITGSASISNPGRFDVIALKRAEMLQEYRQQLMRAGNKTSDVFRAIYGTNVSSEHEDDVIPRFLETFGEDLFVDPVTATADTGSENDNGALGSLASRGKFRGDSKNIKFNAGGNFGLIICLTYVVPTAEYNSYMFDKHIFELSPELHYIPQLENYGLEPIFSDELNSLKKASDISVLGYGPRYYHKKSEVDMVHGAFCSFPELVNFDVADSSGQYTYTEHWYGDFNNWVSPRTDMQNRVTSQTKDFYINPSVLDNIFVRAAGSDFSDDQFICNTYFEIKATKMMSKIGLINFV